MKNGRVHVGRGGPASWEVQAATRGFWEGLFGFIVPLAVRPPAPQHLSFVDVHCSGSLCGCVSIIKGLCVGKKNTKPPHQSLQNIVADELGLLRL